MITDGYITYYKSRKSHRNPSWGITLKREDEYILEYIKNIIGIEKKIIRQRNESVLTVCSQKMVDDLEKYGVVERKSFIVDFPVNINNSVYNHLVRGIFDGDGCITNNICVFYGNDLLLSGLMNHLMTVINIKKKTITYRINGASSFAICSKADVQKLKDYMYLNATIYLKRKFVKFPTN